MSANTFHQLWSSLGSILFAFQHRRTNTRMQLWCDRVVWKTNTSFFLLHQQKGPRSRQQRPLWPQAEPQPAQIKAPPSPVPCVCFSSSLCETVVPLEDPIITETTSTLQEWGVLWKQLYVVSSSRAMQDKQAASFVVWVCVLPPALRKVVTLRRYGPGVPGQLQNVVLTLIFSSQSLREQDGWTQEEAPTPLGFYWCSRNQHCNVPASKMLLGGGGGGGGGGCRLAGLCVGEPPAGVCRAAWLLAVT